MSGILDRMAKRALGALPAVQPLTAPRYAPSAPGLREPAFAPETALETEGPAAVRGTESKPRGRQDARDDEVQQRREHRPNSERNADLEQRTLLEDAGAPIAHDPQLQIIHAQTRSAQPEIEPLMRASEKRGAGERARESAPAQTASADAGARPIEEVKPTRERNGNRLARPAEIMPRPAPMERRKASIVEAARDESAERRSEISVAPRKEERAVSRQEQPIAPKSEERPGEIPAAAALLRNRKVADTPYTRSRELPANARQPAAPAEEKTEIHISIGSIELRAPRPEPRPQPAPFRPRVTLDEFLRRKPEARS